MIYSKLEGTTSQSFKLGKNGVSIANEGGLLKVLVPIIGSDDAYEFIIGVNEVDPNSKDIPSSEAIINYIQTQIGGSLEGNYLDLNTTTLQTVTSDVTFSSDVTIQGNLNIQGALNQVSTESLIVQDKTITLADGALNSSLADGAGIIVDGADASILYNDQDTTFDINIGLKVEEDIEASTFVSTASTGTAPLTVSSTTVVSNLNADKLDGADLETEITASDSKVPTSQAVLTFAAQKNTSAMPSLTFPDARKSSLKDTKYVQVYDEVTGESRKVPLSEIHRPSSFIVDEDSETTSAVSNLNITKIGDFVYIKE
jgi:hypothetical protein